MLKDMQPNCAHDELLQAFNEAMNPFQDMPTLEVIAVASQFVGVLMAVQMMHDPEVNPVMPIIMENLRRGAEGAVAMCTATSGNC